MRLCVKRGRDYHSLFARPVETLALCPTVYQSATQTCRPPTSLPTENSVGDVMCLSLQTGSRSRMHCARRQIRSWLVVDVTVELALAVVKVTVSVMRWTVRQKRFSDFERTQPPREQNNHIWARPVKVEESDVSFRVMVPPPWDGRRTSKLKRSDV